MTLLNQAYVDAKKILADHRSLLDEVSLYLLAKETITGDELMAYVNADLKTPKLEQSQDTEESQEAEKAQESEEAQEQTTEE